MNVLAISEKLGLDYDEALEYFGGDVAALKEKLASLREDARFEAVLEAEKAGDENALIEAAHRVRKTAEKLCLVRLEEKAESVEKEHGSVEALKEEWAETVKVLFPED